MVVVAFLLNLLIIHSAFFTLRAEQTPGFYFTTIGMAESQSTSALAAEEEDSEWEYEYHETETEASEHCLQR